MNNQTQVIPLRTSETIDKEAADWLAKLDGGNLSSADRRALKAWLSQDAKHALALKSLVSIWSDMDFLLNEVPVANEAEKVSLFSLLQGSRWMSPVLTSACIVVIALFAWVDMPVNPSVVTESSVYVTNVGKQRIERFSDGSSAHLNTDSIIETEYSGARRIVRLIRGEALFDVVHDSERPFIVYVGDRKVRAVGTKFVVRLTSENIVVTVTDGQVQLSKRVKDEEVTASRDVQQQAQEVILISKGEEAKVADSDTATKLKEVKDEELDQRLAWMTGQLVFKNEKLEKVIAEISRYVPTRIVIDDPELRDVLISGRFEIGDTDALLEAIEVSLNVQASRVGDQTIHLSR